MAESTKKDIWTELRKPFPKESVGKLPKAGISLDYVGHAAVTDRLNTVDPLWTWEPMALDPMGVPYFTSGEPQYGKPTLGLWIRLTIGGVTRPGFGDGKNEKEAIGDAIRNAAMRFGVALDLWSKDELESNVAHPENKNYKPSQATQEAPEEPSRKVTDTSISEVSKTKVRQALRDADISHAKVTEFCMAVIGKSAPTTEEDATALLDALTPLAKEPF